jgi:transposase
VDFAAAFWHVDCVRALSEKAFAERYRKWCRRAGYNFRSMKAAEIHAVAFGKIAATPKNANTKFLIAEAAAQLTAVSKTTEAFRAEMTKLAAQLPEYPIVMAMYGVGDTLGPQLIAEIGDSTRFSHKKSLVAFAGVDAPPFESGKYKAKDTEISKRGSAALRKALFLVMSAHLRKSPANEPVYQFLDKKRAEGKPYYVYMTAGANKFLRIYYAKVKEYLRSLNESN